MILIVIFILILILVLILIFIQKSILIWIHFYSDCYFHFDSDSNRDSDSFWLWLWFWLWFILILIIIMILNFNSDQNLKNCSDSSSDHKSQTGAQTKGGTVSSGRQAGSLVSSESVLWESGILLEKRGGQTPVWWSPKVLSWIDSGLQEC